MRDTLSSLECKVENLSSKGGKLDRRMVNVEQRMEKSEARTQVCEKEIAENKSVSHVMIKKLLLFRMKIEETGIEGKEG